MTKYQFTLVKGHQVASGLANDPRFPHGTIAAQQPYFLALGLNLDGFYPATLNAQFNCTSVNITCHDYYFQQVQWHPKMPPEDFKFTRCYIIANQQRYGALVYQPLLATKTEHFQARNQLELLAPYINNISYGDHLAIEVTSKTLIMVKR
ncbi:MAG: hypothetical protein ACPG52_00020 [Cognaticolwellia sp.]